MTWTGDAWPGPFGPGPFGPEFSADELQQLQPYLNHLRLARWRCSWLNDPSRSSSYLTALADHGLVAYAVVCSALDEFKDSRSQVETLLRTLRPDRCKKSGEPYCKELYASTLPTYMSSLFSDWIRGWDAADASREDLLQELLHFSNAKNCTEATA